MIKGLFMAWGCFSAIPCPYKRWDENCRKWMLALLPVIGLLHGAILVGIYALMDLANLPPVMMALAMTLYPFMVTGCIHMDGFMDCSDAILSRRDLPERQRILKDSHVGAFAVISVVMLFVATFACMLQLMTNAGITDAIVLALSMMVARQCVAVDTLRCKPMGKSQYAAMNASKTSNTKYLAVMFVITFAFVFGMVISPVFDTEYYKMYAIGGTIIAAKSAGFYGRSQLGGMSGDIAGYSLTIGELVGIITLTLINYYIY